MKLGLSTYSLQRLVDAGELTVPESIAWIAAQGAEHVEVCAIGKFDLVKEPPRIDEIRQTAAEQALEISGYCVGGNFIQDDNASLREEINLVKKHVEAAAKLGVTRMRHDVASRPAGERSVAQFMNDIDGLVEACREIADYANTFGITTSLENHGFYLQSSERVLQLVNKVNRANFKTTLDIGNFLCVDEAPIPSVRKSISQASIVHIKDFYIRPAQRYAPGEGWFRSEAGNYLRGAIAGHGDIDLAGVIQVLKQANYDGYISIEFEGMEDPRIGAKIGMDNVRRLWSEVI